MRLRPTRLAKGKIFSASLMLAATAVVVVTAATSTGIPVSHVAANNGGVWLTNDALPGSFGDMNVPVGQLAATLPASSTLEASYNLDVLQSGTTVLAFDQGAGRMFPIDVADGTAVNASTVRLLGGAHVAFGGGVAAVAEPTAHAGRVGIWAGSVGAGSTASLQELNPAVQRQVAALSGAQAIAVDTAGDVFVASPDSLLTLRRTQGGFAAPIRTSISPRLPSGSFVLTAVGTVPVVVDTLSSAPAVVLPLSGRRAKLPSIVAATGSTGWIVAQQSGPTSAGVLVATPNELLSVPLFGGGTTVLSSFSGGGVPAQPVSLDGCDYGAWAGAPGRFAEVCPGIASPVTGVLPALHGGIATLTRPVFRVNNNEIVLNDSSDGAAWTVAGRPAQVIAQRDWQRVSEAQSGQSAKGSARKSSVNAAVHRSAPELHNPELFARPGLDTTLHVLDDDVDPGGSILSILSATPPGDGASLHISPDGQAVVISLPANATSPVTFGYEVIDGFGLTKNGSVTVSATHAETPPVAPQDPSVRHVVSGATVTADVLGGWRDHENDPLSVSQASVPSGEGSVTSTSDGVVTFTAPSVAVDTPVTVTYSVTDGRSAPVTGHLHLVILGRGDLVSYPPTALPDSVGVVVGRSTSFNPLANDLFGADPTSPDASLALAGPVAGLSGLAVTSNVATGALQLLASQPGVYSLQYQASYGSGVSAPTQILVDATVPRGVNAPPVTTPISIVLHGQYVETIDVLNADYDPAGGLLSVVAVNAPSDISATIVGAEYLRIAASSATPLAQQVLTYKVSDGRGEPVPGQVVVDWQPAAPPAPPVVPNAYATVRAGDTTDIPVLAAASDPDGESVQLLDGGSPQAVTAAATTAGEVLPTGLGSASIEGGYLRYAAPPASSGRRTIQSAEGVTLTYVVESQSGERSSGQAFVTVNPATKTLDTPPVPAEIDAHVIAGGTIAIAVPTTGLALDGDSATVTGVTSAPTLGRVLGFTANSITYQAYPTTAGSASFSGGTDQFSYRLEGPSGLSAQGIVRVSVIPPAQAQPPVAVNHYVTAAPGAVVDVNLVAGAVVAPGDQLSVVPLAKLNPTLPSGTALIGSDQSTLQVTAPRGATPLTLAFGLTDGISAPSVAHVVVRDQPRFVAPPTASDYFPAPGVPGAHSLAIDVLSRDSDPSSSLPDLVVVGSPVVGAEVRGAQLVVPLIATPRAVPYEVRSTLTGATAIGVVYMPPAVLPISLDAGKVIDVPAHGSTVVDVNSFLNEAGHSLRLTTNDSVGASPSGGLAARVQSNTSVLLEAAQDYIGPGSLTVTVTDAASLSAKGAQTATFSIPVQVGRPTPVIRCPATPLTLVEGGPAVSASIAGLCQIWTPNGEPTSALTFTESWSQQVAGVDLGWVSDKTGRTVSLVATSGAKGNSQGSVRIGVAGAGPTAAATLGVEVVAAGPPTVGPINVAGVETGSTTSIDVAQYVTSPLAQPRVAIVSVGRPAQGSAAVTFSGANVRITPETGANGVETFPFVVSDQGVGRSDRYVSGQIELQVIDKPGQPTALAGTPGSDQVTLSWSAAPDNGGPIDFYEVSMGGRSFKTTGTSFTWTTGLQNGQSYSFSVRAHNRVGYGPPSAPGTFQPNSIPDAPTNVAAAGGDSKATVSWTAPFDGGKPIDAYTVSISPSSGAGTETVAAGQTSYIWTGLNNAVGPYSFTIVAHNADGNGAASTASNSVYAHGTPATPPAPAAAGSVSTDQSSTTITVTWPEVTECNDAQPCANYSVTELKGATTVTSATVTASQCSTGATCATSFGPIANDGTGYSYELKATNAEGDVSATSAVSAPDVYAVGFPSQVTDLAVQPGNGQVSASFTLPASHGSGLSQVNYLMNGSIAGTWTSPGASGQKVTETIGSLTNGTSYSVEVRACSVTSAGTTGGCGAWSTISSSTTATPFGPPSAPTVTASQSGNSVVYNWSGGGNNGRPVAQYAICVDGSCSTYASAGSTTIAYACSTNHTVTAKVTDSVGQVSPTASASANTASCAAPNPPSVSASASGTSITYSWSGGGGSGLPVASYTLCIDGACSNVGASAGSTTVAYACAQTHSATAYVTDTIGQNSANSGPASATTNGCPAASISKGATYTGSCSSGNCEFISFSVQNLAPNTGYTVWFSTDCAGPYSNQCLHSPPDPGASNYKSVSITTDANGNYSNPQISYFGYTGATVWLDVGAPYGSGSVIVQTNQILW